MDSATGKIDALLEEAGRVAVAVSGGVDSLTLGSLAQRTLRDRAQMIHAVSPAVPPEATARVCEEAKRQGWRLEIVDAGEFADDAYRANPANRCFFCKSSLYGTIARRTDALIVSGANLDDLDDVRPGLVAAANHGVRHPYIEAGIDKEGVRRIARTLGLGAIAELPASPCLSSRIETGLRVEPVLLTLVHEIESLVRTAVSAETVRCRIRRDAMVVEMDTRELTALDSTRRDALCSEIESRMTQRAIRLPVRFAAYRRGSAFLDGRAPTTS